jgi:hypothetical protein
MRAVSCHECARQLLACRRGAAHDGDDRSADNEHRLFQQASTTETVAAAIARIGNAGRTDVVKRPEDT